MKICQGKCLAQQMFLGSTVRLDLISGQVRGNLDMLIGVVMSHTDLVRVPKT
jgi:hypothetical protein